MTHRPVWAEVDLDAVAHNAAVLAAIAAPARLCAVVKADGYRHGAVPVVRAALRGGATSIAVALTQEGAQLRDHGIQEPILVLSQAGPDEVGDLVAARLDATAYTEVGIANLARAAEEQGRAADDPVAVHLKVDTGMHRVGCPPEDAIAMAERILAAPALRLAAVFTHFAVADEPGNPYTDLQLDRYRAVLADLEAAGIEVPFRHACNTAGALDFPEARFDMVRCGIGIYGLPPSPEMADRADLRPAMSLKAKVGHVKRIAAGEAISYGLRYRTERETTIATVPLGYGDGVPRIISFRGGEVLIGGKRRPIAGTLTMDQMTVDCGDDPVAVGDEVVLLGEQDGVRIDAQAWAEMADTITYEIVTRISPRVPRHHLEAPR